MERVTNISKRGKPWYAFTATLDFHNPGYTCPDCPPGDDAAIRSLQCADKRTEWFVNWVKSQPWFNETLVVMIGDHNARLPHITSKPEYKGFERMTYNVWMNAEADPNVNLTNRQYANVDMLPTILSAAGIKVKGDRIGVGTNLFSQRPTFIEEFGLDAFLNRLGNVMVWYNDAYIGSDESCTSSGMCFSGTLF